MKLVVTLIVLVFSMIIAGCGSDESAVENDGTAVTDTGDKTDTDSTAVKTCGNKVLDTGEECDGTAKSCKDIDASYTGGMATCGNDCKFDVSECAGGPDNKPVVDNAMPEADNASVPDVDDYKDPTDVTSGFSATADTQCAVDRTTPCSKAEFDAWSGIPQAAPGNVNVQRSCFPNYWIWAPIKKMDNTVKADCNASKCLAGETAMFVPYQGQSFGMCTCFNLCTKQEDKQKCASGARPCIAINDYSGKQVFICGGTQ